MSRRKKPSWTANVQIGRSPKPGAPLYDLDSFSDASIRQWKSYGRAVRDFHYALFFDLAGQRAARHKDLRDALQRVPSITVSLEGWCRLVNFKYSYDALSPAGSLRWVGQRFNFGADIDPARFAAFPALYLAENFETAFREYHGLPKDGLIDGLRPDELSLEDRGNWATLQVTGDAAGRHQREQIGARLGRCRQAPPDNTPRHRSPPPAACESTLDWGLPPQIFLCNVRRRASRPLQVRTPPPRTSNAIAERRLKRTS